MDRTSNLEAQGTIFKKQATVLERKLWWKNAWLWVLICILLVVVRHAVRSFLATPLICAHRYIAAAGHWHCGHLVARGHHSLPLGASRLFVLFRRSNGHHG